MQSIKSEIIPAVTPYLIVKGATEAIEFYHTIFGAKEIFRLTEPNGKIAHAEIHIGTAVIMLADEYPDHGAISPHALGGSPVMIHLRVDGVDDVVNKSLSAGATLIRAVKDEFFGDRNGMIMDPFGHTWMIATRIEVVSHEEMQRRFSAAFQ